MDILTSFFISPIRAIIGTLMVFFLPGFAWTLVLFRGISNLERVVLSFVLSISFVSLIIVFTNLVFKIRINTLSSFLTIFLVTIIPLAIHYGRCILGRKGESASED